MDQTTRENLLLGAVSGLVATLVQTAIGKVEEKAFLPPWEDSNIAPRLVDRVLKRLDIDPSLATEWVLGTAYHLSYGASWGVGYAAVRERRPVHPLVGGALLGGVIYGVTFTRWGGAVQMDVERHPRRRTPAMELVAASVTLGFGLSTAFAYEYLRESDRARALAGRLAGGEEGGERREEEPAAARAAADA